MTAGLNVAVFGTDPQTRNQYIVVAIAAAFRSRADVAHISVLTYGNVVRHCIDAKVDILVVVGGAGAIVEPLHRAVKHVRTSVLWTTEDPYELDRNVQLAGLFDMVFTNDVSALRLYPSGAKHLPFAASDKFHDFPVLCAPGDFLFDLFFVGTAWPERVGEINALLARLKPGLRKKIGLSGNPHLPNFHLGDLDLITNFRLAPREFARMANRSMVALTLDRTFGNHNAAKIDGGTPPPRLFELALAGTAQIYVTERATVVQYFAPGEEIVIVDGMAAAAEAIHALIKDPDRREKIASAARQRALRDHLYSNRVAAIIDAVAARNPPLSAATPAVANKRKRILLVSHNVAGVAPYGGVELYQETYAQVLSGHDFSILYPDRNTGRLQLKDTKDGASISFDCGSLPQTRISDSRREEILGEVIQRYNFDLVHYHNLIGHPLDLPLISYAFGIPSVFQVHDYFCLCNEFTLVGYKDKYCDVADSRVDVCDICLSSRRVAAPGAQTQRRWVMSNVLGRIDAFVHSSEYSKRKFAKVYPYLDMHRHHVIGNTARRRTLEDLFEIAGKTDRGNRRSERLQVAVLGNFTHEKGGDLLIAMFWQLTHDPIDIHIIGRVDSELAHGLDNPAFVNVKVHGKFDQSNLALMLRDMDVSVHFSIWPETYCISLDEARAAGLVPIVLGYGALAERVHDGIDGVVIDKEHPFDLIKILRKYWADRSLLAPLQYDKATLKQGHDQHFDALDRIYDDLFSRYPVSGPPNLGVKSRSLLLSDLGLRFNSHDWTHLEVTYDESHAAEDFLAIDIESSEAAASPRTVTERASVERWLRPGDDAISLVVDEATSSIATEKIVFVPDFKTSLAFAIGVPINLDRAPFEFLLLGGCNYRLRFGAARRLLKGRGWSVCRLDLTAIEPGLYSLAIGFRAGNHALRYGSGTRLSVRVGDEPVWRGENEFWSKPWQASFNSMAPESTRESAAVGAAGQLVRKMKAKLGTRASGSQHAGARAYIDSIGGLSPKKRSATNVLRASGALLKIVGWAVPRELSEPFDAVVVRLIGEECVAAAPAVLVARPDVAQYLKKSMFVRSGFEWTCPMESLAYGSYRLEILGVDAGGTMHGAFAGELVIQ